MPQTSRRKVLITGAAGGMGRACARLFGMTHDLVLTDVIAPALDGFVAELTRDGYTVAVARAGDLADDEVLADLAGAVGDSAPFSLIHTAGLSPALADWRAIMRVNLIATEKLLQAIEPVLAPGSAAVVIASIAGHMVAAMPEADALMKTPLAPDFLDRIGALIETQGGASGTGGLSYMLSKRATHALCEQRAMAWGQRGARIVTISPGMILTPMGRTEMEKTPGAAQMAEIAPAGRAGVATDIAMAALFLASDQASFITGCDLRVDGGATALFKGMAG
jgi:NAD(P)-dependent dehydrogenase (short-subunit alcohol dehydrogenase family)